MTTQKLPGTDAARHGTGDADLTIMLAAHDAFRRDLTRLARTASAANLADPARRQPVAAGWDLTPGLALAGLGLGAVIAPLANVVLADVREQDAGSASGVLNTGFQLGNSIGLALMGVIFIDRLIIGPGASAPRVFAGAVEHALWFQVGVFGLAFLLMLALPARRGHNTPTSSV